MASSTRMSLTTGQTSDAKRVIQEIADEEAGCGYNFEERRSLSQARVGSNGRLFNVRVYKLSLILKGKLMKYSDYERLLFEQRENGVLAITINRPEKFNAADERMKFELAQVWVDVNSDRDTRVAVITGAGKAFCAGGDLGKEQGVAGRYAEIAQTLEGGRDLVLNMLNCDKPIISAINGVAVGAGLAIALMADISIIGEEVRFTDGHMKMGVVAGDHATMIWPLLCGMAKAKYYLLTADFIDGREAERIGLVSKCVPLSDLMRESFAVADKLGCSSVDAIKWTKRSLNNWLHQARPIFESSLAHEMLTFFSDDMAEGVAAIVQKRAPSFPSARKSMG